MDVRMIFIVWMVTSVSLYVITKIPSIGVEIDTPTRTVILAAVFGILTAAVRPISYRAFASLNIVTVDLLSDFFTFIFTILCFVVAASIVEGFRLRFGIWSAAIGSFTLSIISSLIYGFLVM